MHPENPAAKTNNESGWFPAHGTGHSWTPTRRSRKGSDFDNPQLITTCRDVDLKITSDLKCDIHHMSVSFKTIPCGTYTRIAPISSDLLPGEIDNPYRRWVVGRNSTTPFWFAEADSHGKPASRLAKESVCDKYPSQRPRFGVEHTGESRLNNRLQTCW
jgi:hypothetical protein